MSETRLSDRFSRPSLSAGLSGVLSAVRFWAVCLIGALLLGTAAWIVAAPQSFPVGLIGVWALKGIAAGFGLPWGFGSLGITLPPTLFTVIFAWLIWRNATSLARTTVSHPASFAGLALTLTGGVALAAALGGTALTPVGGVRTLVLTVLLPAIAFGFGRETLSEKLRDIFGSAGAEAVAASWPTARRALVALVISAHVLIAAGVLISVLSGTDTLADYSSPLFAAIGLGAVQAIFAPTILLGTLVWSTGLPVTLTAGADYSVFFGQEAPLPAIPIFHLVPAALPGWAAALLAVPVAAVAASVVGRRAWYENADLHTLGGAAVQLVIIGAVCALFTRGGIGPGGLTDIGPYWFSVIVGFAVWALAGFCLAYLLIYASTAFAASPAGNAAGRVSHASGGNRAGTAVSTGNTDTAGGSVAEDDSDQSAQD